MRLTYFEAITKIGNKELIFITKNLTTMVSTNKTIVSRSLYEAPACKLYSINFESVMQTSSPGTPGTGGYGDNPMDDIGD